MKGHLKSRSVSFTFLILSCVAFRSGTSLAQNLQAGAPAQPVPSNRVTLTQQAPPPSRPVIVPRHDSFCSEDAWDDYFNSYSDVVQSSSPTVASSASQPDVDDVPYTGVDPMERVEEIPDERVQSMARVQEIPDERVQGLPRIGE
jgi:hypothetical protein